MFNVTFYQRRTQNSYKANWKYKNQYLLSVIEKSEGMKSIVDEQTLRKWEFRLNLKNI